MTIHIGTDDMRKKMGEILDRTYLRGDEFIIERKNRPLAALIPIKKLAFLQNAARQFLTQLINFDSPLSEKDAMILADEAKHASRKKRKIKKSHAHRPRR